MTKIVVNRLGRVFKIASGEYLIESVPESCSKEERLFEDGKREKLCLAWTNFESNISVAFREIREEKEFFDVTLVCNKDQIQAHKVLHLAKFIPLSNTVSPNQGSLLFLLGGETTLCKTPNFQ